VCGGGRGSVITLVCVFAEDGCVAHCRQRSGGFTVDFGLYMAFD